MILVSNRPGMCVCIVRGSFEVSYTPLFGSAAGLMPHCLLQGADLKCLWSYATMFLD